MDYKSDITILAIDIGTTNVKASLFNEKGEVISLATKEVNIFSPVPGSAVQRLDELYKATLDVMREAIRNSHKISIDCISFSAQMHGLAAIDDNGREISPLITYLDTRPGEIMDLLSKEVDPYTLYKETGCPPIFIYPLAKLVWLRVRKPNIFKKAKWFLSIKDYVMYKIFGEPYIDRSVASGSQLLNIHTLKWSDLALEIAGIDEDRLPSLVDGEVVFDSISKGLSRDLGIKEDIPIVIGGSDGALHSLGVGAVRKEILALNIGTSGAVRSISNKVLIDKSNAMRFFCYYLGYGIRIPGGAINNAGICLRWFRDSFGYLEKIVSEMLDENVYDLLSREAEKACTTADKLIILPFFSGERFPVRDPYSKCVIFGLTLRHNRRHIIRGIMEGVVYVLRWIYDAMRENGLSSHVIRTGGGGSRSRLWRQIQADIFGIPVEQTKVEEASLLGAAIMGATALGVYKNIEEAVENMIKIKSCVKPIEDNVRKYEAMYQFFKYLYGLLREAFVKHYTLTI